MGLSEIDRSFARLGEQSCRPSTPAGKLLVPETTYPAALFQLGFNAITCLWGCALLELVRAFPSKSHCTRTARGVSVKL